VDGVFLPAYWRLVADMTAPLGFIPEAGTILTVLVLTTVVLCSALFWSKRTWPHVVAFALAGALAADTPYALLLPLVAAGVGAFASRLSIQLERRIGRASLSWGLIVWAFFAGFAGVVLVNFVRYGSRYVSGYVGNARTVLFDRGLRHPLVAEEMDGLLERYAAEILREADGRTWLFTDGTCDAVVACLARQKGVPMRTIPLVGVGSDGSCQPWSGLTRADDLAALRGGSGSLLRAWTVDRPECLEKAAFQSGFAFLEHTAKTPLASFGLVMRTGRMSDGERVRVTQEVSGLAEAILRFYWLEDAAEGGQIRMTRFYAMQWCVSGALRRLAEKAPLTERKSAVNNLVRLAEALDRANPVLERGQAGARLSTRAAASALTPREGLSMALKHTDYALARDFAQQILKEDEKHAEANFAIGMDCLLNRKYAQANYFLGRAHAERPKEPAILNNLALVSLAMGDADTAERQAREALALAPETREIKDTLSRILAAKSKQGDAKATRK